MKGNATIRDAAQRKMELKMNGSQMRLIVRLSEKELQGRFWGCVLEVYVRAAVVAD
jgi:hypothetical protein